MDDIHNLVGAYALGAVEPDEKVQFEEHLRTCSDCRAELDGYADALEFLASKKHAAPPPELKSVVMEAIDDEPTPIGSRRRGLSAAIVAMGAGIAAVVMFGIIILGGGASDADRIEAILQAPDAQTTPMDGTHGMAAFTFSPSLGEGVFHGEKLTDLPSDQVYQLWVVDSDTPSPSSTFTPSPDAEILVAGLEPGLAIEYTVEPAGGSDAPTTDPLAVASL